MAQELWEASLDPALWQKAISAPETITPSERHTILNKPADEDEEIALVLSRCNLTPSELQSKSINSPSSLTETERMIIIHGPYPLDPSDHLARIRDLGNLGKEGQNLQYRAIEAVRTAEEKRAFKNASEEESKVTRMLFHNAYKTLDAKHPMVERILERRRRDGHADDKWGFVVFRLWFGEESEGPWEGFLSKLMGYAMPAIAMMRGGHEVSEARKIQVVCEPELGDAGYSGLVEYFTGLEVEPGLEKTVFLAANKEVILKAASLVPAVERFVYVSDAGYVSPPMRKGRYEPTFKVELGQVFISAGIFGTLLGLNREKSFRDMYDKSFEDPNHIFHGFK